MKFLTFDETRDFPYYKDNPRLSKTAWAVLLLSVPIAFILYGIGGEFSEFVGSILFCFGLLIPLLYFSKWDYSLIFKKPSKNEILLGILMFIGYMTYALIMTHILEHFGLAGTATPESMNITIEATVSLIFSMMGEELVKFIPLMFLLRVIFKFTGNRKLSIATSTIIVMIGFALIHLTPDNTLASVLLLQGLGTIFEMYGYLKTKNLFVPYISHFLTDAAISIVILLGFS